VEHRSQAAEVLSLGPHEDRKSSATLEFEGAANAKRVALLLEARAE